MKKKWKSVLPGIVLGNRMQVTLRMLGVDRRGGWGKGVVRLSQEGPR